MTAFDVRPVYVDRLLVALEHRQGADQLERSERPVLPVRRLRQEPSAQLGHIRPVVAAAVDPCSESDRRGVHGLARCQRAQQVERLR